jgi:hypothetical protein
MLLILVNIQNDLNMEQATIFVLSFFKCQRLDLITPFRYLIKNTPIESGPKYVLHNLQPQN